MRFKRPFDVDREQVEFLRSLVARYYEPTRARMPEPGAWRSMDGEALWKYLIRIIMAIGRSAPSYRLIESSDFGRLTMRQMRAYQSEHGNEALIKRVHGVLAAYGVRYCSPRRETSVKARAIVANLDEPAIVNGADFVLLDNLERSKIDPRSFLMEHVHMYGMKSASEFLIEIGHSQDYMAFDSRLKRVFSAIFARDFDRRIRTADDYLDFEEAFREEICPELGLKPSELDAIVFWNYGSILTDLKAWQAPVK